MSSRHVLTCMPCGHLCTAIWSLRNRIGANLRARSTGTESAAQPPSVQLDGTGNLLARLRCPQLVVRYCSDTHALWTHRTTDMVYRQSHGSQLERQRPKDRSAPPAHELHLRPLVRGPVLTPYGREPKPCHRLLARRPAAATPPHFWQTPIQEPRPTRPTITSTHEQHMTRRERRQRTPILLLMVPIDGAAGGQSEGGGRLAPSGHWMRHRLWCGRVGRCPLRSARGRCHRCGVAPGILRLRLCLAVPRRSTRSVGWLWTRHRQWCGRVGRPSLRSSRAPFAATAIVRSATPTHSMPRPVGDDAGGANCDVSQRDEGPNHAQRRGPWAPSGSRPAATLPHLPPLPAV